MSKVKGTVGSFIMVGFPVAFGVLFAAVGYRYAGQHVHDVWAELRGPNRAVAVHDDYMHSGGGIAATAGALALAWFALSAIFVLAGGKMVTSRHSRWD